MMIVPKIDGGCDNGVVHRARASFNSVTHRLETAIVHEICTWCGGAGCAPGGGPAPWTRPSPEQEHGDLG